jgi:hypothetical protein
MQAPSESERSESERLESECLESECVELVSIFFHRCTDDGGCTDATLENI